MLPPPPRLAALSLCLAATLVARATPPSTDLPAWIDQAGARPGKAVSAQFHAADFGAVGDGKTLATSAIQKAIDACAGAGGGTVDLAPGTYVSGALFLRSHVHLVVPAGATLLGSNDETLYPDIPTRVAGIEMNWPAALINVNGQQDVEISGAGAIDGHGEMWWKKYWDLRAAYDPKGIRWAADYDCKRVRLIVIANSSDVTLKGVHLRRAGFWTVQVVYSDHTTVDGITITDNSGPSTDGVDIDSSTYALIQHCDIDNNDDDICLKSGRDSDGLRVNKPTEYVVIRDNLTRRGGGVVSFGSETAGGIRHIVAYNDKGLGTSEGIRFKSARTRGGYIEDVLIRDVSLENVKLPFTFTLNWYPSYSYAEIPEDAKDVPAYWHVLATKVEPVERGYTTLKDITIDHVTAKGATRLLSATGLKDKPLGSVRWSNIVAAGQEAGAVSDAVNWTMDSVRFITADGKPLALTRCVDVATPEVEKAR